MELRPYQAAAKNAIFAEWDKGTQRTLLVLPTGCGKTIVFAKVTEDSVRKGKRVLILAHRGELLNRLQIRLQSQLVYSVHSRRLSRAASVPGIGSQ